MPVLLAWTISLVGLLLLRSIFVLHSAVAPPLHWMLLADAAAAALVLLAVPLLLRRAWLIALYAPLIALAYWASAKHVGIHGSHFRMAHIVQAVDGDFLASTLTAGSVLLLPLYLLIASLWLYGLLRSARAMKMQRSATRLSMVLLLVVLFGHFAAISAPTQPANNVIAASVLQLPGALWQTIPRNGANRLVQAYADTDPVFFLREDAGRDESRRPNVLLVMVEGLSGAYLPSIAAHQGLSPETQLPELDELLGRYGFQVYPNVLAMQRQTNRGTYPLLCGDYPKLVTGTPKMTVIADAGTEVQCLPRILAQAGYRTAYLQAAALAFMNKDVFMPLAGFQQQVGKNDFDRDGVPVSGWGPNDEDFFHAATQRLLRFDSNAAPWFATLLNVGTHHPFLPADQDYVDKDLGTRRQRSFYEMSQALAAMLDSLESAGVLDDTLVILTSDEAGGFHEHSGRELVLHNNFGMLAVRAPADGQWPRFAAREMIVAQIDIPVTILDLLGLSNEGNMVGRSLLHGVPRRERGVLFGDTYLGRSYFLYEDGELIDCDESLVRCQRWDFEPARLFGSLQRSDAPPRLMVADRQRVAGEASVVRDLGIAEKERYSLAPGIVSMDRPYRGGQQLSLGDGDLLKVILEGQALAKQGETAGGDALLVLRDAKSGAVVKERRIRVEGAFPLETRMIISSDGATLSINVDLQWFPERASDVLAVRRLELEIKPGALNAAH